MLSARKRQNCEMRRALSLWLWIRRRRKRRVRRFYVRGINLRRNVEGAFASLVTPMRRNFPEYHFAYFRMTKSRFDDLLRRIHPAITHSSTHRLPLSATQRLAMTLRFLCDGGSLADRAFTFHVHQCTLGRIVKETTAAIWNALNGEYLAPPDRRKWEDISNRFWTKWNFPMALGAIDGKHVAIKAPPNSGSLFYNYKKFFSVVLLAMADADYNFIFVDIGGHGSEGDAALFRRSSFGQRVLSNPKLPYDSGGLNIPFDNCIPGTNIAVPHVFLGDEAFALQRHIMKPYRHHSATGSEHVFNFRLSTARRVLENAFGVLSSRFRILDGRIDMLPEQVDNIVKACVVLHNYLKANDANDYAEPRYMPQDFVDYINAAGDMVDGGWRTEIRSDQHNYVKPAHLIDIHPPGRIPYEIRERFKNYFVSEQGKIPWQDKYVSEGRY